MLTDEYIEYIRTVRRYSPRTREIYREVLDGFAAHALEGEATDETLMATLKPAIIRNYEVVEKKTVVTPAEIKGIVKCNNPKCITNNEPMTTYFHVADGILTCHYCEKEQDINKVELV